jgi:hypothetical protein
MAWRYPFDRKFHVQVLAAQTPVQGPALSRTTSRMLHCRSVDVAARGITLVTPRPLAVGDAVTVLAEVGAGLQDFDASVAWSTVGRAGLRLALQRLEERTAWNTVIAQACEGFVVHEMAKQTPTQRPVSLAQL